MSKIAENARMALVALLTNKLRALLTTIGIGIGIAAVIVLVSLGDAVQGYVTKQFMGVGSDLIYVRSAPPAGGFGQRAGRSGAMLSSLTNKDVALLEDSSKVPNVKAVVPVLRVNSTVFNGTTQDRRAEVSGTTAAYFGVLNRQLASGRLFDEQDVLSSARVAVIGQTTVKNLFSTDTNPIGENIRIGEVTFKVIGTLQTSGSGSASFGADQDDVVIIPITAAQSHLVTEKTSSGALPISQIYLQAANLNVVDDIVSNATQVIRTQHKIKAGADDDFNVNAQKDLLESFEQTISALTIFLAARRQPCAARSHGCVR